MNHQRGADLDFDPNRGVALVGAKHLLGPSDMFAGSKKTEFRRPNVWNPD